MASGSLTLGGSGAPHLGGAGYGRTVRRGDRRGSLHQFLAVAAEQGGDVLPGDRAQARPQGVHRGVRPHLRGVEDQLLAPDQAGLLAQLDHALEETPEEVAAQAIPDAGEAGVVGQRLVQVVTQIQRCARLRLTSSTSCRSERIPSKTMMSCKRKKTTGSMEGRLFTA